MEIDGFDRVDSVELQFVESKSITVFPTVSDHGSYRASIWARTSLPFPRDIFPEIKSCSILVT